MSLQKKQRLISMFIITALPRDAMDQSWQKVEHRVSDSLRTPPCLGAPQGELAVGLDSGDCEGPQPPKSTRLTFVVDIV
jgi:hypothetical protein